MDIAKYIPIHNRGKIVIHFTTHGCMAQDHEFTWIGKVVKKRYSNTNKSYYYIVEILKDNEVEARDRDVKLYKDVYLDQLQKLSDNLFICYD